MIPFLDDKGYENTCYGQVHDGHHNVESFEGEECTIFFFHNFLVIFIDLTDHSIQVHGNNRAQLVTWDVGLQHSFVAWSNGQKNMGSHQSIQTETYTLLLKLRENLQETFFQTPGHLLTKGLPDALASGDPGPLHTFGSPIVVQ